MEYKIVEICEGSIRGKKANSSRRGSYFSFQGIPYAKPPVGELRFKAPAAVESWSGIKDATKEGSVAPAYDLITKEYNTTCNEDCLYLNVYTPKDPENKPDSLLPVLFWIHGGGFISGSGNTDFYGPDYLISENVVLVTCNYRLGALGFLSLETSECPGNNGLKDIIAALKWCQKNIAKFGGDPKNVTIFGESAGGAAVHLLAISKKTEGLFHKAIAQSGVALNPWGFARKPRESAFKLGEILGCKTNNDHELLNFLKTVNPKDLVKEQKKVLSFVEPQEYFAENAFLPCIEPEVEEAVLLEHPEDFYKSGNKIKIPFLLGANTLEGLIMTILKSEEMHSEKKLEKLNTDKELEKLIPRNLNIKSGSQEALKIVEQIRKYYFPKGFDERSYIDVLSRVYFLNGINQIIDFHRTFSSASIPTYVYRFTYNGNVFTVKHFLGFGDWNGTCHGDELSYLFKQSLFDFTLEPGTKDFTMMETLTKIWTDFARTGNPMSNNRWSPIDKNNCTYMDIGETLSQKSDLEKDEFEFWKNIHKIACEYQSNCKL